MDNSTRRSFFWLPIVLGIVLAGGIYIGSIIAPSPIANNQNKINDVLDYIQQEYVDTIDRKDLVDHSIEKILEQLDPHSAYIPAEELASSNEPLEGNFEGIGVEFHIQEDTVMVVTAISGGPSEQVGILSGDRLVAVDGKSIAGIKITNEMVFKTLRGKGGTKLKLSVYRRGNPKLMEFKITRGKIPIYSVDVAYMVNSEVGYIKINRFAATTVEEFMTAMDKLENQGMKKLILDLRGNPGGYLDAAIRISDEFLAGRKLLVYTKGKSRPKTEYFSEIEGTFESGKLVVMVDEGSASASEIVSGAVQDWDRATIVGRRSFGKGLVQEQTVFPDGSGMRLTIARYYTPTGRSIQKPYSEGYDAYENEVDVRFKHGELLNKDSIHFSDSLSYKTPAGKIVYGGGGIMPDVFVPIDTTNNSDYLNKIFGLGVLSQFAYDYVDANRISLKKYTSASQFKKEFVITESLINEFVTYASNKGVSKEPIAIAHSLPVIKLQVKAYIARLIWQNEGLYPILHEGDMAFKKALEQLK